MDTERRKQQRVEVFQLHQEDHSLLPIWMFPGDDNDACCGLITNIHTEGAALLIAKRHLNDSTQLQLLDIQLADHTTMDNLSLTGRILWIDQRYSIKHALAGIRFDHLSASQQQTLSELLVLLETEKHHILRCDLILSDSLQTC